MNTVIFHIDVNSAYLSWSAQKRLAEGSQTDLRLLPSIVGGDMESRHGIVLAKSIPAKKYGITTGEPIVSALRKCPGLLIEPPDHSLYHRRSQELMDFLSGICPEIEQVSVDECFLNFTPIAMQYSSPEEAAYQIKDQIKDKFGFTVNIGISDRKVLAKMASDFRKPDKVHTLYSYQIAEKMWPLPVSSLFMCGKSSTHTLNKLEIKTIGDLARADKNIIYSHLKSHGLLLWEYANGIDDSVVISTPDQAKGIGNSTTFSEDITKREDAHRCLLPLSDSVSRRLRQANLLAGMISVEIKYSNFQTVSHQTSLPVPSSTSQILFEVACRLFDELWSGSPVRLLGIRSSKLTGTEEPVQLSLFDLPEKKEQTSLRPSPEKLAALDKTLDKIRQKYGPEAVTRGSLLPKPSGHLDSPQSSRH